jgi:hypothetical protein
MKPGIRSAPSVGDRSEAIEAARFKLATIVLELAAQSNGTQLDADKLRDRAIDLMYSDPARLRQNRKRRRTGRRLSLLGLGQLVLVGVSLNPVLTRSGWLCLDNRSSRARQGRNRDERCKNRSHE